MTEDIYDKMTVTSYKDLVRRLKEKYEGEIMTIENQLDFQIMVLDFLRERHLIK